MRDTGKAGAAKPAPVAAPLPIAARRAPATRPFREVATRSLGRAATTPLPVFIPEAGAELAGWLSLPRDRQALLAAIAARMDAESQAHLRLMLARGVLGQRDLARGGDLAWHLARLCTEPAAAGCDQGALLETAVRGIAIPGRLRAAAWIVVLARTQPAELARLVADLAGPAGNTLLESGVRARRSVTWLRHPGDLIGRLLGSAVFDPPAARALSDLGTR